MIALLLATKDEAEVLRLNIAHHLSWGVDHVAVADNESSDGTQDVLREFGEAVSTAVFHDFALRQGVRTRLLDGLRSRHGRSLTWIGVSDTDEFHWAPGTTLPDLLAEAPQDVVAVNCRQKLFLPTAVDSDHGAVYTRQHYRTTGPDSPLHTSYREGKSFYREPWLKVISSEHLCREAPLPHWSPAVPTVHHYMIRDEDQFVMKVRRLTSWRERKGLKSKLWYHKLRRLFGAPLPPFVAGFKSEWWTVYRDGGEDGLRRYYRDTYCIQADALDGHVARGELIHDIAFADWRS